MIPMHWIDTYHVFLLDFDGLLMDTEKLHFQAYKNMCRKRGFTLPWDFATFCQSAHFSATALKENIYTTLPELFKEESRWEVLYKEKTAAYMQLLLDEDLTLMPGVERFLTSLEKKNVTRGVVTNSLAEQIQVICAKIPLLQSIPHFITREQYSKPKPDPECYHLAMEKLAKPSDKVIGFEDSTKGLTALTQVGADAVLISSLLQPPEITQIRNKIQKPFRFYPSFNRLYSAL